MHERDSAAQTSSERLAALEERLRSQVDEELTDAEVEREAEEFRGRPRVFRPPSPRRGIA
jgi:hypothetical protein